MDPLLLGLDCGHTVTKAVLIDPTGKQISVGKGKNKQLSIQPSWQERDMQEAINASVDAIKTAIAGVDSGRIVGVGVCGHSDGVYILDKKLNPLRNAILATDNRAQLIAQTIAAECGPRLLELIGQFLFPASPAALLVWLKENEPENYARIGAVLHCKDWIRFALCGVVGSEISDASGAFADMRMHQWSDEVFQLIGLSEIKSAFHKIFQSTDVVGGITAEMARRTGLQEGTPVVAGAHDVHAAAVGVGAYDFGITSMIFGTWSINQVFADKPIPDPRWHTRASVTPDRWLHMSTSPASASNANWFWNLLQINESEDLAPLLFKADGKILQSDRAIFLPYLFGGPAGTSIGGQLIGMRGWHTQEDLVASVMEGIIFNHKHHADMLKEKLPTSNRIIATGGSVQSPIWTQLIADIFDSEIEISDTQESGAKGAAMLAGVGVEIFSNIQDAISKCVSNITVVKPRTDYVLFLANRYQRFRLEAMRAIGV